MHQSLRPNKERQLHSECGVCGREDSEKVLIGSPYDGGDGHAANACAEAKIAVFTMFQIHVEQLP
jgi:hypothetical protein